MPAGVMTARSHMLLRVDLPEGTYLADVGFGALTPTAALALRADVEQATPNEAFRLRMIGEEYLLQASIDGGWADIYQLALLPQLPSDYAMVNWYTATRPNALVRREPDGHTANGRHPTHAVQPPACGASQRRTGRTAGAARSR